MSESATDWIKPGAEVAVYRTGGGPNATTTVEIDHVARVATKSFTLAGREERFDLATQQTKRLGSDWHQYRFVAARPDDERVVGLRERIRRDRLKTRAVAAVDTWRRDQTQSNRLAAIEALQAVED